MFAITNASQQLIVSQMAESPSVQHTPATQPAHLGVGTSRSFSVAPNQGASDTALVKAVAGGDRRAMQMLYTRHNVRVYRFILRLINDRSLAEDLVSEFSSSSGARPRFQSEVGSFHLVIGHCPLQGALGAQASFR